MSVWRSMHVQSNQRTIISAASQSNAHWVMKPQVFYEHHLALTEVKGLNRPGILLAHLQGFVEQSLRCYSAGSPS